VEHRRGGRGDHDRRRHIGQTQPVPAWRITAAQTIDARIAELIDSKAGLADQALDGSEEEVESSADVQHEAEVPAQRGRCAIASSMDRRSASVA
jgi:predicted metal-binding transcription factor (methanogenesis marker protein 9)